MGLKKGNTPWKIHMEHKNGGCEDDFSLQMSDCYVPCQFSGV